MKRDTAQPGDGLSRRGFLGKTAGLAITRAISRAQKPQGEGSAPSPRKLVNWRTHPVAKIPHGYQVAVADVNGDGGLDILALSSEESIVNWYDNPAWASLPITTRTKGNISIAPLKWKGYSGRGVALATDFHLEDSRNGGNVWWASPGDSLQSDWNLFQIGTIPTSHRLRWADLDGDGRPELLDIPILGAGATAPEYSVGAAITCFRIPDAVWRNESLGGHEAAPWESQLIDDSLTVVHGVLVLDWNGDGHDEFLTASREGINLFSSTGSGKDLHWTRQLLTPGLQGSNLRRGSSEIGVGKLAGNRFLATIEPWHGEEVAVFFQDPPGGEWKRQVIDSSFHDGHALACADLDGDGNDEIVAGYRGQGTSLYVYYARDAAGKNWERQVLDTDMAAACVAIADMNGDSRPDIVAIGASTGNIKWYENLG